VPSPSPVVTPAPQNPPPFTTDDRKEAEEAAQNQANTRSASPKTGTRSKGSATPAFRPLEGPPPAISPEKQQRLGELLRRYQADEITPAQYHAERAKILAQP
jgi:hypothetical protein